MRKTKAAKVVGKAAKAKAAKALVVVALVARAKVSVAVEVEATARVAKAGSRVTTLATLAATTSDLLARKTSRARIGLNLTSTLVVFLVGHMITNNLIVTQNSQARKLIGNTKST